MAQKKKSSFRGQIVKSAKERESKGTSYLNLPKGVSLFIIKEKTKKVAFDILPYIVSNPAHADRNVEEGRAVVGAPWFRAPFKVHRNVGANDESCICPKSVGKPCPICDHQKKRYAAGASKEETKELYPKDRSLYALIPLDTDLEEVVHVWDVSDKLFQETLIEWCEEDSKNEDFPSLDEGQTLEATIKWKAIGDGSPFPEVTHIEGFDREPYDESVLDEVPELDKILRILSYEELSNKFFEMDTEDDGGSLKDKDDDEEKPSRRRPSKSPDPEPEPEPERPARSRDIEGRRRSAPTPEPDPEPARPSRGRDTEGRRISRNSPDPEPDPEPAPEGRRRGRTAPEPERDPEPAPTRSRHGAKEEATEKDKCPYGHVFGKDCEKFDDCDSCDLWSECIEAKEKLGKK